MKQTDFDKVDYIEHEPALTGSQIQCIANSFLHMKFGVVCPKCYNKPSLSNNFLTGSAIEN